MDDAASSIRRTRMTDQPTTEEIEAHAEATAARAANRVSFQLTYARSPIRREFAPGELTGPNIPSAYRDGATSPGEWCDSRDIIDGGWEDGGDADQVFATRDEDGWIDRYANYAINEAVHEALEWYRVDGKPWLDPHGKAENDIYEAVNRLVDELAAIRRRHQTGGDQ